ncbi:hypothetical protein R6Z07M_004972 [Ovis aries]
MCPTPSKVLHLHGFTVKRIVTVQFSSVAQSRPTPRDPVMIRNESVTPLVAQRLKRLPPVWETRVRSLSGEDPLEKEMVTHSNILAWRIPWMEKPGLTLPSFSVSEVQIKHLGGPVS